MRIRHPPAQVAQPRLRPRAGAERIERRLDCRNALRKARHAVRGSFKVTKNRRLSPKRAVVALRVVRRSASPDSARIIRAQRPAPLANTFATVIASYFNAFTKRNAEATTAKVLPSSTSDKI